MWLDNDMNNTDSNSPCHSCQVEESVLNGTASQQDRNHWSLWGCTCTTESQDEAMEWMDMVTR
jgi:hypothetical protein